MSCLRVTWASLLSAQAAAARQNTPPCSLICTCPAGMCVMVAPRAAACGTVWMLLFLAVHSMQAHVRRAIIRHSFLHLHAFFPCALILPPGPGTQLRQSLSACPSAIRCHSLLTAHLNQCLVAEQQTNMLHTRHVCIPTAHQQQRLAPSSGVQEHQDKYTRPLGRDAFTPEWHVCTTACWVAFRFSLLLMYQTTSTPEWHVGTQPLPPGLRSVFPHGFCISSCMRVSCSLTVSSSILICL